jgi:hypothetical protein
MTQLRQKQEDPLNLRSLPMVSAPADVWPAVEAALRQDLRRRMLWRIAGGALAAAATLALALGLHLRAPTDRRVEAERDLANRLHETPGTNAAAELPRTAAGESLAASSATLETLITLSQQLEARLRTIRAEGGSLPASAVVYQVELEDLVIQVDEELSRDPESLALWSQRVSLLTDLEQLYENRLRREYHRMASL